MEAKELQDEISSLTADLQHLEQQYNDMCSQNICMCTDLYTRDPPEPPEGYHVFDSTNCDEEGFETDHITWFYTPDGTENTYQRYTETLQRLQDARNRLDQLENMSRVFQDQHTAKVKTAQEAGKVAKTVCAHTARQALDKIENPVRSELNAFFEMITGVKNYATLPDDDPLKMAWKQGVEDRLKIGGLGQYRLLDEGQVRLESYVDDVVSRVKAGYAPGSSRSLEDAQQLVNEEVELAFRQGIVFEDQESIVRFTAELACAVFKAMRTKRSPRGHPRTQDSTHKPQDMRRRLHKVTDQEVLIEIAAHKQQTLDKFLKKD